MSESYGDVDFPEPAFLQIVAEHIAHPIFVKDRQHRWVWVNAAFEALTGFSRMELLGRTDHDFFPKEQADFFHAKDREVFSTGTISVVEEERITDAQGQAHVLATTKAALRNDAGVITHLVGIIHDITRRKSVEEALRGENLELESRVAERTRDLRDAQQALLRRERLVVLGQLAGGLAHQIRHPLSVIQNAIAIVRRRVDVGRDEDLEHALFVMGEEVREADRIISDLIEFARVREASLERVDASALLDGVLAEIHVPDRIRLVRVGSAGDDIWVDPRQTRGALGNLIRNAIEAIEGAGRIEIGIAPDPAGKLVWVADDGPGIAPQVVRHLFDPLVTSKPLGLGLGLCTARALIENQGGSLVFAPSEKGARFEIRVPVAAPE